MTNGLLLVAVLLVTSGASSCNTAIGGGAGKGQGATTATFSVTGSAPSGVDITYGNDSSNYQGPSKPPMRKSLKVENGAIYYAITAQLNGGGDITCEVDIGDARKVGHASGGYNICTAQLNADPNGGWDP